MEQLVDWLWTGLSSRSAGSEAVMAAIVLGLVGSFLAALVGVGLAIGLRIKNLRVKKRWEERESIWRPLLLEVLASSIPAEDLHRHVEPSDHFDFVEFITRYTWHISGHERLLLQQLARPYLEDVAEGLASRDLEHRARTVQMLGMLWPERYSAQLVDALRDDAPLVAMSAARALAQPETPEHASAVLSNIDRFEQWSVGFLSAMLASMGPAATETLRDFLADPHRSSRARVVAAEALWEINDFAAAGMAATVLADGSDDALAIACLDLLGQVGTSDHLPLVERYCRDPRPSIRARALDAVGRLDTGEGGQILHLALSDPEPGVALAAARAILNLEGAAALRKIVATGASTSAAAHVLAESGA